MREWLTSLILVCLVGLVTLVSFRVPPLRFIAELGQQAFSPVLIVFREPAEGVAGWWRTVEEAGELRLENERLRSEVARLNNEVVGLKEAERENRELREQLRLQQTEARFQYLAARIIGHDPTQLVKAVTIAAGSSEGVREGMTVVTASGLAGRVVQVGPVTARVLLVTDSSSSVTAITQETRARGVVVGQRGPALLMRYVSQADIIRVGDRVITSGLGGVFPEGILIGKVVTASKRDVALYQEAIVEPAVNLDALERVLVITNFVPLRLE